MSEDIELHSFCVNANTTSDIEVYQEVTSQVQHETSFANVKTTKFKKFDFFTDINVKSTQNQKNKKIEAPANIMDIVQSELASATLPVTEAPVVTMLDKWEKDQSSFLLKVPSVQSFFRKSQRLDYKWSPMDMVNLSPIFPRILENATSDDYYIPVQYMYPLSFEELGLEQHTDKTEGTDKFLDITIKNLKFLHHHLFSLEKMLCVKLLENYQDYQVSRLNMNDLAKEIKIKRETKNNMKAELLKISPNKKDDLRFDKTVRKYTSFFLQLKKEYSELLKKNKDLVHKMTSLWSDIEMVREKSDKIETSYILEVVNNALDESDFHEKWTKVYNIEFNDLLDEIEYEYVTKYIEYKDMKNDQNLGSSEKKKLSKPKLQIDEEVLNEQVEEIVNNIVTRDEKDFIFRRDESILTTGKKKERNLIKYHFDIYVDTSFVCSSESYTCEQESLFEIEFTESFSIQILAKNQYISIALIENDDKVSVIRIDISKIGQNYTEANFSTYTFTYSNMLLQPTYNCIGSGYSIKDIAKINKVRLKSSNIFEGNLESNCKVGLKMGWNNKLNKHNSEDIKYSIEIGRKLARLMHGLDKPNVDSLTDIIIMSYGKNILKDSKFPQIISNICDSKIKSDLEFSINEADLEFVRLKLLHLRNIGGFTNVQNKMVPLHASQLSTEQLSCLQKRNSEGVEVDYINDKCGHMEAIELQRFISCKYVQKLNQNMLKNLHDHLMKRTHKDVVRDYRDLSLRNLFSSKSNLTTLVSIPKSIKQQYLNDSINKQQEIRVTVIKAYNLMDRNSTTLTEDNEEVDTTIAGFKVRPLRPYIRLSYHGISTRTATAIGCHPTWNQILKINTILQPISSLHINLFDEYKTNITEGDSGDESSHGHYSCSNRWLGTLQVPLHTVLSSGTLRGTFKITTPPFLFGYDVVQNKDTSRTLIPAVTRLLKKDTSFIVLQITSSLSYLGGLHGYNQPIPSSVDDDDLIKHLNNAVTEYTNDFSTRNIRLTFIDSSGKNKCVTQFLQPIPLPNYEYFPKNPKTRGESALSKSSGVSKSSSSKSSDEKRRETDIERGTQSPREKESTYSGFEGSWKDDSQLTKMMNVCLRYVSLIPTYDVTETHVVTLTGLELLKVLYGSLLDHTILLASYFLYLGIKCWVVIGNGLPRGLSSYVLTKYDVTSDRDVMTTDQLFKSKGFLNKSDGYLWYVYDSTTGERFELRDITCPLKTVDYVFDEDNIWLNIQSSQDCENVSFDLAKSSNWKPVFDKRMFIMKQGLVTDPSLYSAPPDITALREMLESKIKIKVQKWRSQLKTIWNSPQSSHTPCMTNYAGQCKWAIKHRKDRNVRYVCKEIFLPAIWTSPN
ncbi:unnamed protein product [Diatraea saccharalis]|uniref:C2 domain-containing protein n=1 Tax=Diatraea saccharalis TaxID=40085 RepID=A0A9N9RCN2_9NEOP|nr:unnamed protein product [Diatraea saccharalis]